MVRIHPDPPCLRLIGAVAQLGEHLLCKQGVVGSIPSSSTNSSRSESEARHHIETDYRLRDIRAFYSRHSTSDETRRLYCSLTIRKARCSWSLH